MKVLIRDIVGPNSHAALTNVFGTESKDLTTIKSLGLMQEQLLEKATRPFSKEYIPLLIKYKAAWSNEHLNYVTRDPKVQAQYDAEYIVLTSKVVDIDGSFSIEVLKNAGVQLSASQMMAVRWLIEELRHLYVIDELEEKDDGS